MEIAAILSTVGEGQRFLPSNIVNVDRFTGAEPLVFHRLRVLVARAPPSNARTVLDGRRGSAILVNQ